MDFLPKNLLQPRNLLVYAHDVIMAALAMTVAFVLRLGVSAFQDEPLLIETSLTFAAVAAVVYLFTGLYRHVWEHVSTRDALNIVRTATATVFIFLAAWFIATRLDGFPRSVPLIAWFVLLMFLAGPRLALRLITDRQLLGRLGGRSGGTPILLIGAGPEAEHFIRAVQRSPHTTFDVLGMVTARASRVGQVIQGIEVLGRDTDLTRIVGELESRGAKPERLVVVRRDVSGADMRRIFDLASSLGCTVGRVPPPTDLRDYAEAALKPQPLVLEDLLGRPGAQLHRGAMSDLIRGRRVLITGAGGSIGAELVRQIAALWPAHLTLLDNGEFNLYTIDFETRDRFPVLPVSTVLADVRDAEHIGEVFAREKPDLVFHAAALKHVPLVENNTLEGLLTNAIGTRIVADACIASRVAVMVLISTDKAVNPINVMGTSKRIAEIYCQSADARRTGTRFITVRFGNVLGSAGSVVPLFQKQIEMGGPVTVTHPEIERYFMTTREAVELVLQASALGPQRGDEGALYVLDMGTPVKIIDLARQMIRLAGKTPHVDIEVKFTGLRAGEKLTEELFHGEEPPVATNMDGILLARPRVADHTAIDGKMTALAEACHRRDEKAAFAIVADLVPELVRAGGVQTAPGDAAKGTASGPPHLKIIK
ncbi:MAG: polysaccharide biosynthesis protein [Rhodobacteraceae bacterium]|nr:polysaccharide biosynthesis protein [Paracoccaceae bacterium]